ncbi:TauD/TfdA family dioxygenase [Leifsonia shinshuensis]|uniref:TauD/TfdA family dioxygenase n=1 Tax=Leifsonia shinshuensis TaxID=150026 RepID=A0A7G6YAU3_9MICO|nr:TauD/TfdA family dioxygenase [Leifsonia shinshuensis]QNE35608.1 TauD/TfdA family dioxygenase [Leifsonia shinshuensis]
MVAFSESAKQALNEGRPFDQAVVEFRDAVFSSPSWIDHGLAVVDDVPVDGDTASTHDTAVTISQLLGRLLPQDGDGALVREVRYRGKQLGEGATGRYSDSKDGGSFHTDGPHRPDTAPEWFALLCVRQAKSGGGLILVLASQIIERLDAGTAAVLQQPFLFDQREEGAAPVARPVLQQDADGEWRVNYLREYIELGHRHPDGTPLTSAQRDALDRFDAVIAELVEAPDRIEIKLEPGQYALIDNRRLLHGRTAFGDDPTDLDRLMIRTWIRPSQLEAAA